MNPGLMNIFVFYCVLLLRWFVAHYILHIQFESVYLIPEKIMGRARFQTAPEKPKLRYIIITYLEYGSY